MRKVTEKAQVSKKKKTINAFINVFLVLFSVGALSVTGVLFYQRVYLTPFWVNGQSMYPTFNEYSLKADGTVFGVSGGMISSNAFNVDYGLMDCHKSALKKIKRFDIIVTKYPGRSDDHMIKRVIGLPGEIIKFKSTNSNDVENGDLYVKNGNVYTFVKQPIKDEYKYYSPKIPYPKTEIVLGDDEYYVLGDNRNNSKDSRQLSSNIKFSDIEGKVIALVGTCDIVDNEPTNIRYHRLEYVK